MDHHQPTEEDWKVAGDLWNLLGRINPEKARTLFSILVASHPETIAAARNALNDQELQRAP